MKIFWSWQNDGNPKENRHFIRQALSDAVEQVGNELGLDEADRPELDHDTKNTPGMAEITATILRKITESAVFVADLTPIAKTDAGKALPNPNVLIELGWALKSLGGDRIIAVLNTASGYKPDDLPFDIRHRRALTYQLAENAEPEARRQAKKGLTVAFAEALRANLGQYVEEQALTAELVGVDARSDDPSIWATASDTLSYDTSRRPMTVDFPRTPRGYIRIIPLNWSKGVPSTHAIATIRDAEAVQPNSDGHAHGDFGPCEEGYVRLSLTGDGVGNEYESRNVAMWFDETGEYWVVHGTCIDAWRNHQAIRYESLMRGWQRALKSAMLSFDRLGASPVRKVEVGLVGIRGILWPEDNFAVLSSPARKDRMSFEIQGRSWSVDNQLQFLTDAFNKMRDAFALPHVEKSDLERFLNR